ncbi:MAG: PTS sugar transporter subunit IIA [Deltaproteobacteria bacterium]|nr:MAG: PTS sugar transporter subunit IIA [Deltaproteobacteria bacterium]
MKIIDILDKNCIIEELASQDKKGALEELVSVLVDNDRLKDKEKALQVLLEREKLGSTGIGDGIAIPHGKLKGIKGIICSFGRSKNGIDFQSLDGKPTHLFFLLLAPEDSAGEHLKALARLSRLLKDTQFRERLMEAKTKEEIYSIIAEEDESY